MERKLATVLFVDLVESTALVAGQDPEVARRRVSRFFEQASRCIQTHGGTVEKFAGDAVMAAFGIPRAHEDDAERAVRAALGIMDSVHELNLEARIGIESGEVVADDGDSSFATGEAVHVAARLQQAARPGEILIGPSAHRLAVARVRTDDAGPLALRGIEGPVAAHRVLAVSDGPVRNLAVEAPLVGRETELELLENVFRRTVRDRRAHLVTLYGEPGVGKSRLAREFVASLDRTTVLFGRSLPYGEGVTYWPVAEMVKAAAGIRDDDPVEEALEKLRATCEIEVVADLLGLASGILNALDGEHSQQELAWAARAWAQRVAEVQPLVLVFEDIHWAEEPLLELIEHLVAWVRDVPLLVVCLARPELLDVRPEWGGGRVRSLAIQIEPLPLEETDELIDALLDGREMPALTRDALLEKTEGNPLFVEETVRMLVESGDLDAAAPPDRIPDTLHALIAARIDRLPRAQRTVLQRAAVIGRVFSTGAVAHLTPEFDGGLDAALDDLLLREFVVDEPRPLVSGERALRFKHVLIRDVAYAGLAKAARAEHHQKFAAWLQERTGDDLLELRAYHLEQAATLVAELDGAPPAELTREAAEALEAAGRRALKRESFKSARRLFLRAVELEPTLERRYLGARAAWRLGDSRAVAREMEQIRSVALEQGDKQLEGLALTALADAALAQSADVAGARALVERALDVLPDDDLAARFEALMARANVASWDLDHEELESALERALAVAQEAGREDLEASATRTLAGRYVHALELERAEPLVERTVELAEASGSALARAGAAHIRAQLDRARGRFEEAEAGFGFAHDLYADVGTVSGAAKSLLYLGRVRRQRGDLAGARKALREATKILKGVGDRGYLCEALRSLAELAVLDGSLDEAERLALEAQDSVGPQDRVSVSTTRLTLGVVRAAQGRDEEAEALLRESLEELRVAGAASAALEALDALATFLRVRGREAEAAQLDERADELAAPRAAPIA